MNEKNNLIPESSPKKMAKNTNKNQNEANNSAVPDFIQKLFRMLENEAFKDVFCWDPSGTSFLVKDTNEFSKSILPKHFKHSNFASFVRQLNKYDFHKIRSHADENQRLHGNQTWEFEHVNFKRDRKDLLEEIKRKTPGKMKKTINLTTETTAQIETVSKTTRRQSTEVVNDSVIEHLHRVTNDLQSQVDQLKRSHAVLEASADSMNKKEQKVMAELSVYQQDIRTKNMILNRYLNQQQQNGKCTDKQVEIESNNIWTDQSAIPIESILDDLFVPTPPPTNQQEFTANTVGPSIKISGDLAFLALGKISGNKNESNPQLPTMSEPTPVISVDKGKRKMPENWTTPPRVLLVDDDSVSRDLSGRMLNMIGCSTDFAKNGVEALEKTNMEKYDLILMDIIMPEMDGIETTRNIRTYDSSTPIVSMTCNFAYDDIMKYIGIGMNDILPKPFSKMTLYDILEKHCAHLKINDELDILRSLPPANITPIMDESPIFNNNYNHDNNNNVHISTNTPSTASSSTPPNNSPTITDTGYWQPLDNRKLLWSSSPITTPSTSPSKKHHHNQHHYHNQIPTRNKD